ncbi:MAG: hypothetical protein LBT89_09475, partial [Planctomycetaceae bacterium]|nr:hypothetical protein [Planctomycetaceae bacterium]
MLRIFVTIIITFVFAAALFAGGETETLRYRRWLAPIEQIENWPFPPGLNLPVNRQLFEQYVQQSVTKCQLSESSAAAFFKTVLTADIDGEKPFPNKSLQGSGTFELPPQRANPDSIPLVPLNIPVIGAKWSDGTEASFVNSANGTLHLVVPNQAVKRLDFRWSLQNKMPVEDSPVFDFALPLSLQSELHFDIPETMTAASTGGIVLSETHNTPQRKLCWILLGQEMKTTVSFQRSNSTGGIRSGGKVPYRQTVSYRLTEQGLDVIVQFFFSKSNVRLNELFAEVDEPLQIAEVRCGTEFNSIAVPWQRQTLSSSQIIRIDLSGVSSEMISGLTLRAVSPMQENADWKLPGVRLKQDNVFWCETRCGVNVFAPLQAAEVFVTDGVQVVPRTVVDAAQRELFTFQFFKPEAFATLKAVYSEPQMSYQSATQIYWGANEIRANAVLECRAEQDKHFAVELPVVENWTVDSVKCFSLPKESGTFTSGNILLDSLTGSEADNTASWNIWNDPEKKNVQKLQIQFKSPLESKSPVIVQLTGRYLKNTQQKFQLETLSPVKVPLRKNTVHLIGVQIEDIPYRLRSADGISTATAAQQKSLQRLTGGVFVLNSGTQTSALELVRAEPDYTAEIAENVALTDNGLAVTVLVRCQPVQSSADRIYVYFSSKNSGGRTWNWTSSDSRLQPLRAKKLSDKEVSDLLPVFKTKVRLEDLQQGETWEIRLPSLQTETFDLQAAATLPLEESITVPLAALPAALSQNAAQKAVLTVVSPHRFDYRIVNSRLQSIPAAAADWNQYSEIQAVFRYSPDEELRRPGQIPLSLQKLQPNETANSAWIWSLRLNSQYEPEGNIKNNTLLCVENRGRKKIRITLPAGINAADISSVLCAGRPADWFSGSEELPDGGKRCSLTVALPEGRRFVTITVEYAYQDIPLTQQRKLRPRYLTADVPVLSGTWTAWFPPEYDVHLHRSASDQPVSPYAHGLSKCLTYWGSVKTFNLVSAEDWRRLFTQRQRNSEAAEIADKFFAEMDAALKKNQITSWGNLLKNDKILANTVFRIGEGTDVKLLVDKQAFRLIGITPATPVSSLITASPARAGSLSEELFDQSGLVLLVSSRLRADKVREYTLGITSPLRLPLYRDIQSERAGHCVRSVAAQ